MRSPWHRLRGSQTPGTYNLYSNWDFNALGTIFEMKTGRGIYDAFEADIARPIGMQDFHRAVHSRQGDTTRSSHLAYHFVLSTRDMARLGHLMLRDGRWGGAAGGPSVVGAHAARVIVTPPAEMNPPGIRAQALALGQGYSFLWWTPRTARHHGRVPRRLRRRGCVRSVHPGGTEAGHGRRAQGGSSRRPADDPKCDVAAVRGTGARNRERTVPNGGRGGYAFAARFAASRRTGNAVPLCRSTLYRALGLIRMGLPGAETLNVMESVPRRLFDILENRFAALEAVTIVAGRAP